MWYSSARLEQAMLDRALNGTVKTVRRADGGIEHDPADVEELRERLANKIERLRKRLVKASRGKVARAEPVASLFESGEAKFAGRFPELEDELAGLVAGGRYEGPGKSPDRADAMVWAMTFLMAPAAEPRVRML